MLHRTKLSGIITPVSARVPGATRWIALLTFAALAAISLPGCGGDAPSLGPGSTTPGGISSGPSGGGSGPALPTATIMSTIASVQTKFQTMVDVGLEPADRDSQIVAFLKTQPAIAAASISKPGCVCARFTNNRYYMIYDNRAPVSASATPPTLEGSPFGQRLTRASTLPKVQRSAKSRSAVRSQPAVAEVGRAAATDKIPQSKQVRLVRALDTATFGDAVPDIQNVLERRGYNVLVQQGTVEILRSITNDGVFYIDTHGGIGLDSAGKPFWNLWTDTQISEQGDSLYAADLNDGSLVYCTAVNGTSVSGKPLLSSHYGISINFVKKNGWGFAKDSLVYLNCCYGADPGSGPKLDMLKLGMPAGSTVGWSAPVAGLAVPVAKYFFDRLLGTNSITPTSDTLRRPFGSDPIYKTLFANNLAMENYKDEHGQTQISYLLEDGADFILTPEITTMEMQERIGENPIHGKTQLTLHGSFGNRQGTVKIGGTEVPILSWMPDTVVCQPADKPGAGFSGDVEASVDDHDSNAVALSQWHGKMTYTIDLLPPIAGTAQSVITVDAIFRADLHDYRNFPEKDPVKQAVVAFRVAQGSFAHWQVNGNPPPMTTWVGPTSADLPFGLNPNPAPYGTGYILSGTIDPTSKKVAFSFNFLGCVPAYSTIPPQPLPTLHDITLTSSPSGIDTKDGYPIYQKNLPATIGDDYVIPAVTLNGATTILEPQLKFSDFLPSALPVKANGEDQDPH